METKLKGDQRELWEWVKADEKHSGHYENVCCRLKGQSMYFTAYYDTSIDSYRTTNLLHYSIVGLNRIEWLKPLILKSEPESITDVEKDLIIEGIVEGSEQWKAEYDNCRALLKELVDLKIMKENLYKGNPNGKEYAERKPLAWEAARKFLEKYQH